MARFTDLGLYGMPTATSAAPAELIPSGGQSSTMTLAALMQRRKELAEREQSIQSMPMGTPWQGAAAMAHSLVNALARRKAERELATGQQAVAGIMGAVNPDVGPTQAQIAQLGVYDPDMAQRLMEGAWTARREDTRWQREQELARSNEARERGQQLEDIGRREQFEERQWKANQMADVAKEQRAAAAEREQRQATADTTLGKLKADLDEGRITPEQYNAAVAKETAPSAQSGMELEFDENGRVIGFRQGPGAGAGGGGTQGAKNLANAMEDYRVGAQAANNLLPTIANMEKAFASAGYTGPGGDYVGMLDDALEAVGSPLSLPGTSGSRAVVRGGGLGFIMDAVAKSKGSISDKETALFQAASPGLSTTREGAGLMLGIAKGVARRAIERDAAANKWLQDRGSLVGFEQQWNRYLEANPLIVESPDGGIMLAAKGAPAAAPGGLPQGVSEDDIAETMRANNMTRQQVLDALAAQGGTSGRP